VINNSCSSWHTIGSSFIRAGARAYVGTLWPVPNYLAGVFATEFSSGVHSPDGGNVALQFDAAVSSICNRGQEASEVAGSYVFIGVPEIQLLIRPSIAVSEAVALLSDVLVSGFAVLKQVAQHGRPDLAIDLHQPITESLRERFHSHLVPGEMPPHLPWPRSQFSLLEADYLIALESYTFGESLLQRTPRCRKCMYFSCELSSCLPESG
jgi:hypothetical protein